MTSNSPNRALRVKSFRGACKDFKLVFDHRKPLTLIYGENGSGKSTICDAYDFIANRQVGSLDGRGLQQTHPHWANSGSSAVDIVVELTVDGRTWTGRASGKNISVDPFNEDAPRITVLRRATLATFIFGVASERYAALRPFIDLLPIEKAEKVLREQIRASSDLLDNAANRIGENREFLRRKMNEAEVAHSDAVTWARGVLAVPRADTSRSIAALRSLEQLVHSASAAIEGLVAADSAAVAVRAQVTAAQRAFTLAEQGVTAVDASLLGLLEAAQLHLAKHVAGSTCPLCESPERAQGLKARVEERLMAASQVRALSAALKQATSLGESKRAISVSAHVKAQQALKALTDADAPKQWKQSHLGAVQAVAAALFGSEDFVSPDLTPLRAAGASAASGRATLEARAALYSGVKTALELHDESVSKQAKLSLVLPRLQQALEVCERQRKRYLEQVLDEIAVEVGRLYEAIHPGEGLNKISFKLDPKRQGSLDLSTAFLGRPDVPPQAYFSESHLDSLGLCIFLALAGRQTPGETIVVLDDVLSSVDEPYVDRVIELLYVEAKRFKHTILTTHYRPWREKFRHGWLQNNQCEFIELGAWTAAGGIVSGRAGQSRVTELRDHLSTSPPNPQVVCAAAGVLLEEICDFLAKLYALSVPYRNGGLTLGDLLPAVAEKRIAATLRVEVKQPDGSYTEALIGSQLIRVREMMFLRNVVGSHNNELASLMPPQDAIAFGKAVHDLAEALICEENGWPRSKKSGSYWATPGETRRLHPLMKPQ
jgi:energy-coupling factor transporter ATP-binding protein EcfA2